MKTDNERLAHTVDDLRQAVAADERDTIEGIEGHKRELHALLERARALVGDGTHAARQRLDELRVQLALGKMESRDTLEEQREKIGGGLAAAREALGELGEDADDRWKDISQELGEQWNQLRPKIEGLRLQWALGTAYAEDELAHHKQRLVQKLGELKGQLQDARNPARESVDRIGAELKETGTEIVEGLKSLFGLDDDSPAKKDEKPQG